MVEIGGVMQGMIIRGRNSSNPVLLFLHGGPAVPLTYFFENLSPSLEDHFTVCYWEQRGAGLSWDPKADPEIITAGLLVDDTLDVARYLARRFSKEKVFLMGHSWGSFIGIQAAAKAPGLFEAYIGVGQVSDIQESVRREWTYLKQQYELLGDAKTVRKLEEYDVLNSDEAVHAFFTSALRETAEHEMGVGSTRSMRSVVTGIFLPSLMSRTYTLREKVNYWRAKAAAKGSGLYDELFASDLTKSVTKLAVPVYFMSGKYDYCVNHDLSRDYLEILTAPEKAFFEFGNSAHSPQFEDPERFLQVMLEEVLAARPIS